MGVTRVGLADIMKTTVNDDGTVTVVGKATGDDLDLDRQRCDPSWLAKAMPEWFRWGNIREQHGMNAAGAATALDQIGNDWIVEALIVDKGACEKLTSVPPVYKGFSIGIRDPEIAKSPTAPRGAIVGGSIIELSLCDRPCNPTCTLTVLKAAGDGGDLVPVEDPTEEASEVDWLQTARDALTSWLASEAAEVADGTGGRMVVRAILDVLMDLDWAAELDAMDDADAALIAAGMKAAALHTTAEEAPVDIVKAVTTSNVAELRKALGIVDPPQLTRGDLVKMLATDPTPEGDAELRKALGIAELADNVDHATKALESTGETVAGLVDRVAKVEGTIIDAGAVRLAPSNPTVNGDVADQVLKFRTLAATVTDRDIADEYRRKASALAATLTR